MSVNFAVTVVESRSHVPLSATPWTIPCQVPLSFTVSQSMLKFMSISSAMLSNHLIFCCPFLLLPSFFPQDQGLFPVSRLFLSSSGLHFHSTYNSTSLRKVIIDLLWKKRRDPLTQLLGCQFPCSAKQDAHFEISWLIQKNIQLNWKKKKQHQFPIWIHELLLNMSVYLSGWSH